MGALSRTLLPDLRLVSSDWSEKDSVAGFEEANSHDLPMEMATWQGAAGGLLGLKVFSRQQPVRSGDLVCKEVHPVGSMNHGVWRFPSQASG